MNKKKLGMTVICVGMGCAIVLSGCGASNAVQAARASDKTAKRCDRIVKKLDTYNDSSYKFPSAFGNEFFVANKKQMETQGFQFRDTQTKDHKKTSREKKRETNTPRTVTANGALQSPERYQSRHYNKTDLNTNSLAKATYFNQVDNLYALCADVSAANEKQNQQVKKIKEESAEMKQLSKELRNKRKIKSDWKQFNKTNKETNKALTELYKDRGGIKKSIKPLSSSTKSMNIGKLDTDYNAVLNKLDTRIKKLDNVERGMSQMNESMRVALGKPKAKSKLQQEQTRPAPAPLPDVLPQPIPQPNYQPEIKVDQSRPQQLTFEQRRAQHNNTDNFIYMPESHPVQPHPMPSVPVQPVRRERPSKQYVSSEIDHPSSPYHHRRPALQNCPRTWECADCA